MKKRLVSGFAAAVVLVAAGAIYATAGGGGNVEAAECRAAQARIAQIEPEIGGEVAAFLPAETPTPMPPLTFTDETGAERRLEEWKGKTVLLNIWATWCAPCRHEMPALDALQQAFADAPFEVVAVSIDKGGPEKPQAFFAETEVSSLALYTDRPGATFEALKARGRAFGLPTTLLVDAAGCELGHLPGPADWASPEARALIEAALRAPAA